MAVSYKKLFHLLIEKNMTNAQLQQECNRRTPPDGFAEQNGRDAERAD